MRVCEVGELGVIREVLKIVGTFYPEGSPLKLGDDASAISVNGKYLVLKVDGTSIKASMYPWMSWSDLGYRVALASVTDVISKGGEVTALLISVGVTKDFNVSDLLDIIRGVTEVAKEVDAWVLGGDTNSSEGDGWVDVFCLGVADYLISNEFSEGDEVFVSGCLGRSAIPALAYYGGVDLGGTEILKSVLRPKPATQFLSIKHQVKASTDLSDGFASLTKVIAPLGLDLVLSEELPLCPEVKDLVNRGEVSVVDVLRYLGEEYSIVFTLKEGAQPPKWAYRLGKLVKGEGRILYKGVDVSYGWDNFRGYLSPNTKHRY